MLNWKRTGFILIFTLVCLCRAEVNTTLSGRRILVGYQAQLFLTSDTGNHPEFEELPKVPGLHWTGVSRSQRYSIVNFSISRESTTGYGFYVDKPGKYVIPSVDVRVGHETERSASVTFEAFTTRASAMQARPYIADEEKEEPPPARKDDDFSGRLFAKFRIDDKRKVFYAGEDIPLVMDVYLASGLPVKVQQYPEIKGSANLIFGDWRKENPENPKFRKVEQTRVRAGGRAYNLLTFRTAVKTFQTGKLDLDAEFPVMVMVRDRSRRRSAFDLWDDDFFDSMFSSGNPIRKVIQAKLDGITIRPLPENKTGAFDLGLSGKWRVTPSISSVQCRAGEAVTLKLELTGTGNTEMLKAPALDIPGFRTYPPEIERTGDGAVIRYVLIPIEPGKHEVNLKTAVFDPVSGIYRVTGFRKTLSVSEAQGMIGKAGESRVVDTQGQMMQDDPVTPNRERKTQTDVLYLKRPPFRRVAMPLWRNSIVLQIVFVSVGLLFWIFCELLSFRKRRIGSDPDHKRKAAAGKERRKLISGIKALPPERVPELSGKILACVNDLSSLPAGSTLDETASALEKRYPDFAAALKTLGVSSWAPGGVAFTKEKKQALLKGLARLGVLLLAVVPFSLAGASDAGSAMNAYDSGKTAEALAWYRSLERDNEPSPGLLYNIGNCLYRQKQYAPALAAYEKARKLRPRDRDILENLNLIRRTLQLPEKYQLNAPGDIPVRIRDLFRPDEWMTLCAFGILLFFIGLGLRCFAGKAISVSLLCAGLLLAVAAVSQAAWQNGSSYAPDMALVTGNGSVSMFELPAAGALRIRDVRLMPGEEVQVIEQRPDWVRIRSGAAEGWVREKDLTLL